MDKKKLIFMFLGSSFVLVLFGLLMIFSASSAIATERFGSPYYFLERELFFLGLSVLVFLLVLKVDTKVLFEYSIPLVFGAVVLLVLPFIPKLGFEAGGAKRWIRLWFLSFQPSELLKPAFAVYISAYLARGKRMVLPPLLLLGLSSILLILEPDLGCVVFLTVFVFLSLFVGGIELKRFAFPVLVAALAVSILVVGRGYRVMRIKAFLNPWLYKTGCGYQLVQSFISFGSGGLFGKGLGCGTEKLFYLPEPHTDFIFAVVGEELGFIGVAGVVLAFFALFLSGYMLSKASKGFNSFLVFNLTLILVLQAVIHMWVNLGLLPPKGIPLPFVSYGGSSLLGSSISLAMATRAAIDG